MGSILIIEDEEFYRNFLKKIVSAHHTCDEVSTGDQAKAALRENRYDVVLYDLRLPGASGRDLVRYVKEEIDPDIMNIVITGYEQDWTPVEATEENVFFYLKKGSFHPDELLKTIDSALQVREARLREKEYVGRLITSEKIAQAGKLATGIAHEINNPLQSLVVIAEHFKERIAALDDSEDLKGDLHLLETGIERIRDVVKQLIELYRIDSSPTDFDRLESLIVKAVNFLRPIGREQHTDIVYRRSDRDGTVCVAENQFFYVLVNICLTLLDHNHREIDIDPHVGEEFATIVIRAFLRGTIDATEPRGRGSRRRDPRIGTRSPADAFGIDISKGILRLFDGTVKMSREGDSEIITITIPLLSDARQYRIKSVL
jgi:signal transduction histidine kinase